MTTARSTRRQAFALPLHSRVAAGMLLPAVVALALGACATVQHPVPQVRSLVESRPAFLNAPATPQSDAGIGAETRWWSAFGDPMLDALQEAALRANPDVRIALERVAQARAGAGVAAAKLLPTVNAVGAGSRTQTGYEPALRQRLPDVDVRRLGLDTAWEVDLFGAARAGRDAARSDLLAADHGRRGAQLAVVGEVARQYFILRGAQRRLAIVEALVDTHRETVRLTRQRFAAGQSSAFDIDRAEAELASALALLPPLRTLAEVSRYRLATLTGRPAGAWPEILVAPSGLPDPLAVAPGQPADLLRRRPDVMAAEAQWQASTHRSDEAQANRYPRLFLSALFGNQSTVWNGMGFGVARFLAAGGTFAVPLFTGGRIDSAIAGADAREREALIVWERAVLQSLEDVEGALVARQNDDARATDLRQSVAHRERSLAHARSLYREGQADLLVVLDVQRGLLAAQLEHTMNQVDRLLDVVQLYRALGGGWQVAEADAARPAAATPAP